MDSRFRGNDENGAKKTFYESIKNEKGKALKTSPFYAYIFTPSPFSVCSVAKKFLNHPSIHADDLPGNVGGFCGGQEED